MPDVEPSEPGEDAQEDAIIDQYILNIEDPLGLNLAIEPGEKADDAIDFEDLSDDDLADDDEEGSRRDQKSLDASQFAPSLSEVIVPSHVENDDLFVEKFSTLASNQLDKDTPPVPHLDDEKSHSTHMAENHPAVTLDSGGEFQNLKAEQLQRELFALSRDAFRTDNIPIPPSNSAELLEALWPSFRYHETLNFMRLLAPKKARYVSKQTLKAPRPLHATKLNLDFGHDQEKSFNTGSSKKRGRSQDRKAALISISHDDRCDVSDSSSLEDEAGMNVDALPNVSWQDLQIMCDDWDLYSNSTFTDCELKLKHNLDKTYQSLGQDKGIVFEPQLQPTSSIRTNHNFAVSPFEEPEKAAAHISKKIRLDLNDRDLVLEELTPISLSINRSGLDRRSTVGKQAGHRYNISNDEAYDLLKENHQHKIRGMLGNFHVEHSLVALRLQWPLYKTRLDKSEARSFHRPSLRVNRHEQITFSKTNFSKKKHIKGKDAHTLFCRSGDLSANDNSHVLLLEYSEEHPMMLSNSGMGSKIINYYRKKDADDTARPKMEIGELNVLLPQDKSPFSLFGYVDSGYTTSAICNNMYRAPIFGQTIKNEDFLLIRNSTGVYGSSWFLRSVQHLQVVGQQFPSVDVPGPHSRKVTTASKNRLKMISFRLARKSKSHRIHVGDVTKHFKETTDMQNRQKMKEFMQFDKDHKEWRMRQGELIPEERIVRAMLKPEDVCLLESMQVGQQHLQDAGLNKDDDDASDEDGSKEGYNIEQQLAPWFTSRNFLNASQGKAMLQLHGEGDPSGRGEALSFIKVSMKGGFRPMGESINERMKTKDMQENKGHYYNVNQQQSAYEGSIRRIWDSQIRSLSSNIEQSDPDSDEGDEEADIESATAMSNDNLSDDLTSSKRRGSIRIGSHNDENLSQSTKWSSNSHSGKVLEVTRLVQGASGHREEVRDISRNPRVIRQYLRRRRAIEAASEDVLDIRPGDDDEENKRKEQRLKKELARLERNKDRRLARDKQRGLTSDGTMDAEGSPTSPTISQIKTEATKRKCANCGQKGHIKTNKKLCPLLNGSRKPEEGFNTSAFTSGAPAL